MRKLSLETDRLILKTIGPSYASRTLNFYERNKEFLEEYEPLRKDYFYTKSHQRQL